MPKPPKQRATLTELLTSVSDVLFPDFSGAAPVTINSTNCDGDTPLHVMTWQQNRHGVQALLEAGANPNAIGDMGETPLHIAVRFKNIRIVELLLAAGAHTTIRSEFDQTAHEQALQIGGDVAKLLKRVKNG